MSKKNITSQRIMYSKSHLINERGWTDALIAFLLPKPETINTTSPKFTIDEMWINTVVHLAEAQEKFINNKTDSVNVKNKPNHYPNKGLDLFTYENIRSRGWTKNLLKKLLPEPNIITLYLVAQLQPKLEWSVKTVIAAEKSPEFSKVIEAKTKLLDTTPPEEPVLLKARLEKVLKSKTKALASMTKIDNDCSIMIKVLKKAVQSAAVDKTSTTYSTIKERHDSFVSTLSDIRKAYVERYNEIHNQDIKAIEVNCEIPAQVLVAKLMAVKTAQKRREERIEAEKNKPPKPPWKPTTYCKSDLLKRGWTQRMIDDLLPPPTLKSNPHYRSAPPMLLWQIDLVEKTEQSEAFQSKLTQKATQIKNTYPDKLKKLKSRLAKAITQQVALELLGKIDSDCRKAIDSFEKALKLASGDIETRQSLLKSKMEFKELLLEIRRAYLDRFNSVYGYEIKEAPQDEYGPVQDLVFKALVKETIPDHPKMEYAFTRLMERKFIIHCGVTNTGKTYHALEALKKGKTGAYLAPLRLLALQVYQQLNESGSPCTLLTGEEEIVVEGARYVSSTVEKMSVDTEYDVAVIDEAQMLSDPQRGSAWTKAILGVRAKEVHVCCSSNAVKLVTQMGEECGDTVTVKEYERDTPLVIDRSRFSFPKSVEQGDALIAFSKKMVLGIASYLADAGIKSSVIYGNLPPETRRKQVEMFVNKETKVVVATDAIGMGLNLPIKRIVFMEDMKFDGIQRRALRPAEIKQIAGRAGRKNIYDEGLVNTMGNKLRIEQALDAGLADLTTAYYLPLDRYILSMPIGTLIERLREAMIKVAQVSPFRGADVEQPIALLNYFKPEQKLSLDEQYRLAFIPFDMDENDLFEDWKRYVALYSKKMNIEVFGVTREDDLDELETDYKRLDLFYSFCKTMNIPFDPNKISEMKQETAARIHSLLTTKIRKMGRTCNRCGRPVPWNHEYGICESCYQDQRMSYSYGYRDEWY